jgi:hypothetical protein
MFVVHYHNQTGRVAVWGNADAENSFLPDHSVIRFEEYHDIDPNRQKIANGEIVDISENELNAWNAPLQGEVEAAVQMELSRTDQFMMPDRDLPNRNDWIAYRKMLRDLSKRGLTPAGMLAEWPIDPNGVNAVAHLRNRK